MGAAEAVPWYKDAVVYQLHVRAFFDSNADGTGDFRGLTRKLDYLQDLGVTALWLLPFYPSPLRDDGYDIADYTGVHPDYGTLADFRLFLRDAHRRGIRVITELVLNHTSDQHPWFRRARAAPAGSSERDFYVWSDTPDRYADARVIFSDAESSNWTWDPAAGAYYWHRFYSHQPDLNFDNPEVRTAMLRVVDLWLGLGVDGLRLDAVPYLFEREGTTCENLPETHAFLKELRAHVDSRFGDRVLVAEANQWPADAVGYFGEGDECHMAFHFPLMPRMFMATRMEDRVPIIDILTQTPDIPDSCSWALFLRNHDELTLEMVSDEERNFMYRTYARDPEARVNLGIRRRLAPLLGNNRRLIEVLNGLLFSLPGTPVVYYGDEIGMGDNIYLGDRAGVRNPMQWSADRNAGFSRANPQRLYLPVIIDPEYHAEALNVEAQESNRHSLLSWMKRLISLRRRSPALSRGSLELLFPDNPKVLAFLRRAEQEQVLVVANLSRWAQYVELDMRAFEGTIPVELFGGTDFPRIGEWPYLLTLSPYAFYWFSLEPEAARRAARSARGEELPLLEVDGPWQRILEDPSALEKTLPQHLRQQRWFGGKGRRVERVQILDAVPVAPSHGSPGRHAAGSIVLIGVHYADGDPERYLLALARASADAAAAIGARAPEALVARVRSVEGTGFLVDAALDETFCLTVLETITTGRHLSGRRGRIVPSRTKALGDPAKTHLRPTPVAGDHSNSVIRYGDRLVLKVFRRLADGVSPELEIGRFLTERGSRMSPPLAGAIEYEADGHPPATVATLHALVPNAGDAWTLSLRQIAGLRRRLLAQGEPPSLSGHPLDLVGRPVPKPIQDAFGTLLAEAREIGERTALLHHDLASSEEPEFAPEPFTPPYRRSLHHQLRAHTARVFQMLRGRWDSPPEAAELFLDLQATAEAAFGFLLDTEIDAVRIRVHGDLHLAQFLRTEGGPVIIDFEGAPARSPTERRAKRSPLQDVAGVLRSFDYAAHTAGLAEGAPTSGTLERWLRAWTVWASAACLDAYLVAARGARFAPADPRALRLLLDAFLVEKALYECSYEAAHRPDWLAVPASGLRRLLMPAMRSGRAPVSDAT